MRRKNDEKTQKNIQQLIKMGSSKDFPKEMMAESSSPVASEKMVENLAMKFDSKR